MFAPFIGHDLKAFDEESLAFFVHAPGSRLYTAVTEFRIIAINEATVNDLFVFKDPVVHACVTAKFILAVPLDSNVVSIYSAEAAPIGSAAFPGAEVHSISALTDELFAINFWNESQVKIFQVSGSELSLVASIDVTQYAPFESL